MATANLIAEVLREMKSGLTAREAALRYHICERTAERIKAGKTTGKTGRPHKLTDAQERVVCHIYEEDEATIFELACVYRVTPQTIKNILRRRSIW